jgi:hypothetical protein
MSQIARDMMTSGLYEETIYQVRFQAKTADIEEFSHTFDLR